MRSEGRKILIGKLGKPHGIKGYIYFHYYGKDLSTLLNYEELILEQEKSYKLEKTFEKSDSLRDAMIVILQSDLEIKKFIFMKKIFLN
jgi:ribosomal 30S subunit maturation factor RimM